MDPELPKSKLNPNRETAHSQLMDKVPGVEPGVDEGAEVPQLEQPLDSNQKPTASARVPQKVHNDSNDEKIMATEGLLSSTQSTLNERRLKSTLNERRSQTLCDVASVLRY